MPLASLPRQTGGSQPVRHPSRAWLGERKLPSTHPGGRFHTWPGDCHSCRGGQLRPPGFHGLSSHSIGNGFRLPSGRTVIHTVHLAPVCCFSCQAPPPRRVSLSILLLVHTRRGDCHLGRGGRLWPPGFHGLLSPPSGNGFRLAFWHSHHLSATGTLPC